MLLESLLKAGSWHNCCRRAGGTYGGMQLCWMLGHKEQYCMSPAAPC